jgi:YjjG family noncanonical pyrimidine nucleotidase
MTHYRCILFDLDHTLWDFETNSHQTLLELYTQYNLQERGVQSFEVFYNTFVEINTRLWEQYDLGLVSRETIRFERFHGILAQLGVDDVPLSLTLSDEYVKQSPRKSGLMPDALEVLNYLHPRYPMTIVTNGFEEVQYTKLNSSGLTPFFTHVVTSARAGYKKPAKEIFEFALTEGGFKPHEAVMIGDNLLTDIEGAHNASVDTIFFNPARVPHQARPKYEIHQLKQLIDIL